MKSRALLMAGGLAATVAISACGEAASTPATATLEPDQILADSLIGTWLDAAGGMRAWDAIQSARFTITTVWFDSTGEIRRMRPRRVEYRKKDGVEQSRIERNCWRVVPQPIPPKTCRELPASPCRPLAEGSRPPARLWRFGGCRDRRAPRRASHRGCEASRGRRTHASGSRR